MGFLRRLIDAGRGSTFNHDGDGLVLLRHGASQEPGPGSLFGMEEKIRPMLACFGSRRRKRSESERAARTFLSRIPGAR